MPRNPSRLTIQLPPEAAQTAKVEFALKLMEVTEESPTLLSVFLAIASAEEKLRESVKSRNALSLHELDGSVQSLPSTIQGEVDAFSAQSLTADAAILPQLRDAHGAKLALLRGELDETMKNRAGLTEQQRWLAESITNVEALERVARNARKQGRDVPLSDPHVSILPTGQHRY